MERYVFFDAERIPEHVPVIGVPMAQGFVWMELTPAEYDAVVTHPTLAQQLVHHAREVIAARSSSPGEHMTAAMDTQPHPQEWER